MRSNHTWDDESWAMLTEEQQELIEEIWEDNRRNPPPTPYRWHDDFWNQLTLDQKAFFRAIWEQEDREEKEMNAAKARLAKRKHEQRSMSAWGQMGLEAKRQATAEAKGHGQHAERLRSDDEYFASRVHVLRRQLSIQAKAKAKRG